MATAATKTTTEMVETFQALKQINLGWEIRQPGEYVPEYMELRQVTLERLIRTRYVERRLVSRAELDAFMEVHKQPEESPEVEEDSETPEEQNAPEESEQPQASVAEESIDGLGPAEEESEAKTAKKVVRKRR